MTVKEALENLRFEVFEEGHCGHIEDELTIAMKALEKQIPRTIVYMHNLGADSQDEGIKIGVCPSCGDDGIYEGLNFCPICGQALDWEW